MARITTYPLIQTITNEGLLLISDVGESGNPTKSVSIEQLASFIGVGGSGLWSVDGSNIYNNNYATKSVVVGGKTATDIGAPLEVIGRISVTNLGQSTYVGHKAGASNPSGGSNTGVGYLALETTSTGGGNTGVGRRALRSNTDGDFNTAIGWDALDGLVDGSKNGAAGSNALGNVTHGNLNVGVGWNAGLNAYISGGLVPLTTSNQSTFLGQGTASKGQTSLNETVIGSDARGEGDNTVVLGGNAVVATYLKGVVSLGITTDYADNAAALAGGLIIGQVYRTGDVLKVVH